MNEHRWSRQIVVDPNIHHGEACFRGTRVPVRTVVASLADGMTADEVIEQYPQLTKDAVFAGLAYAADVLREESLIPLSTLAS